jgi:phosphomannomutase
MAAKFGTSGLRGLVGDLTDGTAAAHARAFARHLKQTGMTGEGTPLFIGRDRRASSPEIAAQCAAALFDEGLEPVDSGILPTPALALYAMGQNAAALMITGSHIPDDRNGVKFYRPDGEIDKNDELAISELAPQCAGMPSTSESSCATGRWRPMPASSNAIAALPPTDFCTAFASGFTSTAQRRSETLAAILQAEGVRNHPVRQIAGLHSGRHRGRVRGNAGAGFGLGPVRAGSMGLSPPMAMATGRWWSTRADGLSAATRWD